MPGLPGTSVLAAFLGSGRGLQVEAGANAAGAGHAACPSAAVGDLTHQVDRLIAGRLPYPLARLCLEASGFLKAPRHPKAAARHPRVGRHRKEGEGPFDIAPADRPQRDLEPGLSLPARVSAAPGPRPAGPLRSAVRPRLVVAAGGAGFVVAIGAAVAVVPLGTFAAAVPVPVAIPITVPVGRVAAAQCQKQADRRRRKRMAPAAADRARQGARKSR
jgi:hypothetical protein